MAVLTLVSDQLAADYRRNTREEHGKVRFAYFKSTSTADGDIGTTVDLVKLPQGAVRVLPGLSCLSVGACGASRTLSIGHTAYVKDGSGTQEALNATAFVNALDVSSAVNGVAFGTGVKYDLYSTSGVTVQAKIAGGTLPNTTVIEGYVAYVTE